ncbi:hypothetical protein AMTRI_Chr06g201190 [Amborella trichopoda]|uniref:probable thiol methyltransferase 2 n=1 Tax=Amborella trichopoda TaxID=13333 RepID=UPI0005D3D419|nr:probable thiol methyltransferase 2 [Amborella trichopoda]XP_020531900.1 probable thiol methyltransferase 2 [Amborella trichopoda]XP_020531901.1 probable thiol methyltransferase 2 [Amborella trichopoda]|eukprot:XP_020531899.1 probable thiol methyltransferase 2 [Amborella trichopoda]
MPPGLGKMRKLVKSDGWDKCWVEGLVPWDLGGPTPVILHLLQTQTLPSGRALVPGCGSGYDVVALASPQRYVVGLDISDNALDKAKELSSSAPNSDHFTFLKADFFNWKPNEAFDLIFDYTFFCAIDPRLRPTWAKRMRLLLKPGGELITLIFPIGNHVGGPPYKVSAEEYEVVLRPLGFNLTYLEDNDLAVKGRKGKEKLGRWKLSIGQSLM